MATFAEAQVSAGLSHPVGEGSGQP
jgi:hypothetical protein